MKFLNLLNMNNFSKALYKTVLQLSLLSLYFQCISAICKEDRSDKETGKFFRFILNFDPNNFNISSVYNKDGSLITGHDLDALKEYRSQIVNCFSQDVKLNDTLTTFVCDSDYTNSRSDIIQSNNCFPINKFFYIYGDLLNLMTEVGSSITFGHEDKFTPSNLLVQYLGYFKKTEQNAREEL